MSFTFTKNEPLGECAGCGVPLHTIRKYEVVDESIRLCDNLPTSKNEKKWVDLEVMLLGVIVPPHNCVPPSTRRGNL